MEDKQTRHGRWLARRIEPNKTLVFVICVEIERSDDDGYVSRVLPLEQGTVLAWGKVPDEAEQAALQMFREMVDHCLETGTLKEFLADSGIMKQVDEPVDKVIQAIESLAEHAAQKHTPREVKTRPRLASRTWLTGDEPQAVCA